MTACGVYGSSSAIAMCLVSWSSTMTSADSASQISAFGFSGIISPDRTSSFPRKREPSAVPCAEGAGSPLSRGRRCFFLAPTSEPPPILARSFNIRHATPADLRMRGIHADIGAIVPAADAFRMIGLAHRDGRDVAVLLHRINERRFRRRVCVAVERQLRHDEEEAELVRVCLELGLELRIDIKRYFGFERSADFAIRAHLLHLLR